MSDLNRLTKAELIKKIENNDDKPEPKKNKEFDLDNTKYDRKRDFPEYEQKKQAQAEKSRRFRETMVNFKG
jgi:hypothetical protein